MYGYSLWKITLAIVFVSLLVEEIETKKVKQIFGPFTKENYQEMNSTLAEMERIFKMKSTSQPKTFLSKDNKEVNDHNDGFICKSCLYLFTKVHNFLDKKYGFTFFSESMKLVCQYIIRFEKSVCHKAIDMWALPISDALIEHYFDAEYICTNRLICKFAHFQRLNPDDYARKLLQDKPNNLPPFATSNRTLKVLHMSDVHTDLKYNEGANGDCGKPLCCREENGPPKNQKFAAGRWGYQGFCDLPRVTVYNFLEFVKSEIKPDFILWTGDAPSHSVWDSSDHEATDVILFFTLLMKDKFNYTIPIYPAIGNHEFYPADLFDPFNSTKNEKTFNITATLWKDWIGEEAYSTYIKKGYYTKKHPNSNLRIISLNTMDCDVINFNIIKNPTDPNGQFAWMETVLRQAEKDNEIIYIIGHIPPGDGTYTSQCSRRYNALVDRFSYIIRGQFYGHTHYDEFRTVHEYFNYTKVAGLIQIAPSLTTYTEKNPQFRVYKVDDESKIVLDYDQYFMNITKANSNLEKIPSWDILYNAKEAFNMTNMTDYSRFINITQELIHNNTLEKMDTLLFKFFGVGTDYDRQKNNLSCRFEKDAYEDYMKCISYWSWDSSEYSNYALTFLSGSWYEKFHDQPHD